MLKKIVLNTAFGSLLVGSLALIDFNEVSASSLTDDEKEVLYQQYVEIVEDVKEEYNLEPTKITIDPIDEFTDESWVDVKTFEERVIDMALLKQSSVVEVSNPKLSIEESSLIQPLSTPSNSVTQRVTFDHEGTDVIVSFTAGFNIKQDTNQGRMVFHSLSSLKGTSVSGTWSPNATNFTILEGGRTLRVNGSGYIKYLNINSTQTFTLTYTCTAEGVIKAGS